MEKDTINLNNEHWDHVIVQVRQGNGWSAESNNNRYLGESSLKKGETWSIDSYGENVYYRRESNPMFPDGTWTGWTQVSCSGQGEIYEVTIL